MVSHNKKKDFRAEIRFYNLAVQYLINRLNNVILCCFATERQRLKKNYEIK